MDFLVLVVTALVVLLLCRSYFARIASWRKMRIRPLVNRHWARQIYLHGGTRRLGWFAQYRGNRSERPAIKRWATKMEAYFQALYRLDRHAARRKLRGLTTSLAEHRDWIISRGETPYWQIFATARAAAVCIGGLVALIALTTILHGGLR